MKWGFRKAERMEKPWEKWDNGYTRLRKLQWELNKGDEE